MNFSIVFCLILFLTLLNLNETRHLIHFEDDDPQIDYIILRQIWPQASCMFPGQHTCSISNDVNSWVVHGLWPSIAGERGPNFCNESLPFDYSKLVPLVPQLLKYWPNLYTDTPIDSFWEHEWTKHGTCALHLSKIRTEFDYFNQSLTLRMKYDFGAILAEQSITPDDQVSYSLSKIKDAIVSKLQVQPILICYTSRDSNIQYLSQMQICFNKQFELIDCSRDSMNGLGDSNKQGNCIDDLPVSYPVIKKQTKFEEEEILSFINTELMKIII